MSQVYLENGATKNQFWFRINKNKKIRNMLFSLFLYITGNEKRKVDMMDQCRNMNYCLL